MDSYPKPYWNLPRIIVAAVALPATLLLALHCGGALRSSSGGVMSAPTLRVAQPNFVIGNVDGDESCSQPWDYCIRASCNVVNAGDAAGAATVEVRVERGDRKPLLHREHVHLQPNERVTVSHAFTSAKLFDNHAQYRCQVS